MSDKSNTKINSHQKITMVDFMQTNYQMLFGKFVGSKGKISKESKWIELGEILNALGPPEKNTEKWKRAWTDMKEGVKKKLQLKRQNINLTGAAPINLAFTEMEERIIAICNHQLLDGDSIIPEIGFKASTSTAIDVYEDSNSSSSASMATKRKLQGSEESQGKNIVCFFCNF